MKIKGRTVPPPPPVKVTIFRGADTFTLEVKAVLNFEEFDKLCPMPKPPLTKRPGKPNVQNYSDPKYLKRLDDYSDQKSDYIFLKAIGSEIEWETVKMDDPDSWKNWRKETDGVLTDTEIAKLMRAINEANSPTEQRAKDAFESFTLTPEQDEENQSTSQKDEQATTQSGEPVSASA